MKRINEESRAHSRARNYFISIGAMPPKNEQTERWVLHHIDVNLRETDPVRYHEWRIEDLQPMTFKDHQRLHMDIRLANGDTARYSHPHSEEYKRMMSEKLKGREFTDSHRQNLSKAIKLGYENGTRSIEGEKNPMFGKHQSDEQKRKAKETKIERGTYGLRTKGSTGMHWYNNGIDDVYTYECPEGFVKGRLKGKNPHRDSKGRFSSANTEVNK